MRSWTVRLGLTCIASFLLVACSGAAAPAGGRPAMSSSPSGTAAVPTAAAASPVAVNLTIPGPPALPADTEPALAVMRTRLTALGLAGAAGGLSIDASGIHFIGSRPPDLPESLARAALTVRGEVTIVGLPAAAYGTAASPRLPTSDVLLDPTTVTPLVDLTSHGARATPTTDATGGHAIEIILSDADATALADYSGAHLGDFLAILVDGRAFVTPVIQSAISGGSLVVTSGADDDTRLLEALLASGPLPAPFGQ